MALTLSRVDRTPRTYVLADVLKTVPASVDGVELALLPPRGAPTAATVWFAASYAAGVVSVLLAGPDADSSGALVVPASADLWMKITDSPEVDAVKVERVSVLGGGGLANAQAFASLQALIGIDTDGVPFYDPAGVGSLAVVALDTDGVPYFTA